MIEVIKRTVVSILEEIKYLFMKYWDESSILCKTLTTLALLVLVASLAVVYYKGYLNSEANDKIIAAANKSFNPLIDSIKSFESFNNDFDSGLIPMFTFVKENWIILMILISGCIISYFTDIFTEPLKTAIKYLKKLIELEKEDTWVWLPLCILICSEIFLIMFN